MTTAPDGPAPAWQPCGARWVAVYGTLRAGGVNDIARLQPGIAPVGTTVLTGTLHDLGWYPGLCLHGTQPVLAEVYALTPALEQALDGIEGLWPQDVSEYAKRLLTPPVALASGGTQALRVLVIAGPREDLVSSGASTTWHDMVLYLIARHAGATDAQALVRLFALQWHQDGLAPYITFEGKSDHGDAEIEAARRWLATYFSVARPVDEMIRRSALAERTFRRFTAATGIAPIAYVQRLRVEDAKRRLERTDDPVDEIGWRVGDEEAAFFRRLFKRTTGMAPGAYGKRFRIPDFART